MLTAYFIYSWPLIKAELKYDTKLYRTLHDDLAVIDEIVLKGRRIVILTLLQRQALDQLHSNHIEIEKKSVSPQVHMLVKHS